MNPLKLAISAALALVALAATAVPGLAVEAAATTSLNVRSGPGTGFAVVDQLDPGEIVDVVECTKDSKWCRIYHLGPDGWVARAYLAAPDPSRPSGGTGDAGGSQQPQFGVVIPLPGGGSFIFGTPGYTPPSGGTRPPAPPAPRPPAPPEPEPETARACVFAQPAFRGESTCFDAGSSARAMPAGWNDRIRSVLLIGDAALRLCEDVNFGGFCREIRSNTPRLFGPLDNKASSYDVTPPEPRRVCIYDEADYKGRSVCLDPGRSAAFVPPVWNDRISSVKTFGGARIRLCQNPGFGGFCRTVNTDTPALGPALNDNASSYRVF